MNEKQAVHDVRYQYKWNIDGKGSQYILHTRSDGKQVAYIHRYLTGGGVDVQTASVQTYSWDAETAYIDGEWVLQPMYIEELMKGVTGTTRLYSPDEGHAVVIDNRAKSIIDKKLAAGYTREKPGK